MTGALWARDTIRATNRGPTCWTGEAGTCRGGLRDGHDFSTEKEAHFFDTKERVRKGLSAYAAAFPRCKHGRVGVDLTPDYLLNKQDAAAHLAECAAA